MSKSSGSPSTSTSLRFGITTWQNKPVSYTWTASDGSSDSGTLATDNSALITGLPSGEIITLSIDSEIEAISIAANRGNDIRRLVDITQWGDATWTTMENAFNDCVNLNVTATDTPDLSAVTSMRNMFRNCQSLTGPANIGSWNTTSVRNMQGMFEVALAFNQDISSWNTANVTNMSYMFGLARSFNQNISNWNTTNVTNMESMFQDARTFNQNIGNWNTQNVTDMSGMFANALIFNKDISNWRTSNVTNMSYMFRNAEAFNQNISSWDTHKVTDMSGMFCYSTAFNQPIGNWNTAAVTNMYIMFAGAKNFNQDIGNWNTSSVTNMLGTFDSATSFNKPIGNWNTAAVTNMHGMFNLARSFNQDISRWDVSSVIRLGYMFTEASAFNQNIGNWQLNPNVDMTEMLINSGMNCINYSSTLNGWANNTNTPSGRNLGAQGRQYGTNAEAARIRLTTTKGWTITGDRQSGQSCGLSQTLTATDIVKTYGDASFIPNATASSGLEVSYLSADNSIAEAFQDSADGNKWKLKINKAGQVNITAKQAGDATNDPATDVIFKLTIGKAPLIVTANALSKEYGTADPVLTYTATGFVNSDDQTVLNGLLTRTTGETIGTYAIGQGTLSNDNYSIAYTGADFTITAAKRDFVTVWSEFGSTAIRFYINTSTGGSIDYFWRASGGSTGSGTIPADSKNVVISGLPANEKITLNLKPDNLKAFSISGGDNMRLIDVAQWGTATWSTMYAAFKTAQNLNITATDIPDFSEVTDMSWMFEGCISLNGPANIGSWNMSNVIGMSYMFYGAKIFNQNIGTWNIANVNNMQAMFLGATKFNQDISSWNTSKLVMMDFMFQDATEFNQDISNWNLSQAHNMGAMFRNATSFNQDISNWNTANVGSMTMMFENATSFNQNISGWNTQRVYAMRSMFNGASAFNQNLGAWQLKPDVNMANMLDNSGLDCQNYSFTLNGWANNPNTPSGRNLGAAGKTYGTNAEATRILLTNSKGWTITGDMAGTQSCGLSQTLTATDMVKTYGDASFIPNATASSGLEVSYLSADNSIAEAFQDSADGNKWKLKINKAGQVNITAKQAGDATNDPASDVIFKLTIGKAPLTITANALSKEYGTADPVLTYTATGFVNSDDQTVLNGLLTRTTGETIGTYAIGQGTLSNDNYSIAYTGADFTITAAKRDFVTKWDMSKSGSGNNKLEFYINTSGSLVPYTWTSSGGSSGSGTVTAAASITGLPAGEIITLRIDPTYLKAFSMAISLSSPSANSLPDAIRLIEVVQWGTSKLETTKRAFSGCENLNITATDQPDLSSVTDMSEMFTGCKTLNGPANIGNWNTTNVTNMRSMFNIASAFNQDIGGWNTANVTNMSNMFHRADAFNQNIGGWNTEKVTNMNGTFRSASAFNQDIGGWNTEKVTDMSYMFSDTKVFNQNISNWNTANVTNMSNMFQRAMAFDQNISSWNTEKVTNMMNMFSSAKVFNQPIGSWNTGNVTNMSAMFFGASAFNQPISNWNTAKVTNMSYMFYLTKVFNQPIGNWDTGNVTDMSFMFYDAAAFNQPISNWNTAKVTTMYRMFFLAPVFNQDINNWNTANVTSMSEMFTNATSFNRDISSWNTANVTSMSEMFTNATSFNRDISSWNTGKVTDMRSMFNGAGVFNQNLGKWQLNPAVNMTNMLDNSGLDCQNYSFTLQGWANNPNTPSGRNLGASLKEYGTNAATARTLLTTSKGWTITGDSPSGQSCGLPQTITANDIVKIYGDAPFGPDATASSGLEVSYVSADNSIAEAFQDATDGNKWKIKINKAGLVNITAKQVGDATYNPASDVIFKLTINKAKLTVTANAQSKEYGTADPVLTYTATGFVNGDDQKVLNGLLKRTTGEAVGTYVIEQGTVSNDNYTIAYTGADFTITDTTGDFVTVWDMSKPGSGTNTIKFYPTTSPGGSIDYFWMASGGSTGGGTIAAGTFEVAISNLPANEIVTLNLKPAHLKAIKIRDLQLNPERLKLIDISQWGTAQWSTMRYAFLDCHNLNITATDVPDFSNVVDMSRMFQSCSSLNGPVNIGSWNTVNVTDMFYLFNEATIFNQDVGGWNTAKVTNMSGMFQGARAFNQNVGSWNTANVTDMSTMFNNARAFNQNISNWNTENVTDMAAMFDSASLFNQDIGNWNTANVTSMYSMFEEAKVFNQDIGNWNTANVTNMNSMFSNARAFNQNIGSWNTAKVTDMSFMFSNAQAFNQNISGWNTQNVTNMSFMFSDAWEFNQNIGSWNIQNVINMSWMFRNSSMFNQDINNWDTHNVTDMRYMFNGAAIFNQNLGKWKLNAAVNMANMFDNSALDCQNYSLTLVGWANNANTPSGRNLGAQGIQYGTNAEAARTLLTGTKGWTITGDSPSGQSCGLPQTITANDIVKTYGDTPFIPNVTASSGLEVSYVSADKSIAEAFQDATDGNKWKIRINKAGQVNITAKQAGDATYDPAMDVIFKLTINKADLTVTANALSKVYGTADPLLTYTATGFVYTNDQTVLTGTLSRATGEAVGTYPINQGTLNAENYNITYNSADFIITKATLNIVADAKSKVYGTTDPVLTYTVTGFQNGDDQSIITGALTRTAGEDVGKYAIQQGKLGISNNYDIAYTGADFTITKATLNIIADAKTKRYGTADPALTYTVTGFENGDDQSIITGSLTRTAGEDVGNYAIQQGTLSTTADYDIVYTGADLTITKATLNITADAKTKRYGTADPTLTYTITGFENGDDQSIITGSLTRTAGEDVGKYAIQQGTLSTTADYDIVYTGADLTITKATLNIIADAKTKRYGTADPALTYTVTGFENGDDQSIITGSLTRTAGEDVGNYAIQQGALGISNNYDIAYTGADFTITKATLNIIADAKTKRYGTADPALTYTVTGFENGDDQSIITGSLTRIAGEDVGNYVIQQGTLSTTADYDIVYTGADLTITKATLNIIADAKTKRYGTADPALTYTITGLENGDDMSIVTGSLTRTAGEAVGTYTIQQGTLSTTADYDIVYTDADLTITKATLNIIANAKTKRYGTADPALTYTVTGLENGDDQSIITGALTRTAGEDVGTYTIQQGTLSTTADYDIVYTGADLTITKATLNITADAKTKRYGTADPTLTYTITGFENGDDQSIITGSLTRIAGEDVGKYVIQQGTLSTTADYDIVYTGADLTITKATLNIIADAKTKRYGTADPALTYTVTGF
ncbi:BspA family leucine-rich repeat surface protein [Sphingobacterium spiritivorum]|uniref:BspA family leucine-rich repeat surface protein n=1 Tax=Sphingobacterium spiritivorum TaxID=258 RepID=UPI00191B76EA|nr:BspA family leucine-rich repeat surface protein [Sphingobacterium spiritivorum]QQT26456.1 BspA family leucine-rich repeat surface protein [Sphingobacterium spiritivorum]